MPLSFTVTVSDMFCSIETSNYKAGKHQTDWLSGHLSRSGKKANSICKLSKRVMKSKRSRRDRSVDSESTGFKLTGKHSRNQNAKRKAIVQPQKGLATICA